MQKQNKLTMKQTCDLYDWMKKQDLEVMDFRSLTYEEIATIASEALGSTFIRTNIASIWKTLGWPARRGGPLSPAPTDVEARVATLEQIVRRLHALVLPAEPELFPR